jgi:hypothetical protein
LVIPFFRKLEETSHRDAFLAEVSAFVGRVRARAVVKKQEAAEAAAAGNVLYCFVYAVNIPMSVGHDRSAAVFVVSVSIIDVACCYCCCRFLLTLARCHPSYDWKLLLQVKQVKLKKLKPLS